MSNIIEDEDTTQYPPKLQMIRNLGKEMWNTYKAITTNMPVFVTAEIACERITICSDCKFYTETGRCSDCGCYMDKKVNLTSASCPQDKWDSVS